MVRRLARTAGVVAAAVALALAACGGNPSGPTPNPGVTFFGTIPNALVLGPGDVTQVYGLAESTAAAGGVDVTASMRLSSANPSIARVDGTRVIGVAPGETDITATYQTMTATVHATVFAPSAVAALTLYGVSGGSACWPNDRVQFGVYAVLDNGTRITPAPVTWTSTNSAAAPVDQTGTVTCASPGSTTIEVGYQGRTASVGVSVRAPQDALELRASGISGGTIRGNTVTASENGFYVLESGSAAVIRQQILDGDGSELVTGASRTVPHGSGSWTLATTFVVPARATAICTRTTMEIIGADSHVPPVPGGCTTVR